MPSISMMKFFRIATALSIVSVAGLGSAPLLQGQSPDIENAFRQGAEALKQGRPADAEAAFRTAIRLDPNLAEAHLDLGLVYGREGKLQDAIDSLHRALRLNPKLHSANMFAGIFEYQSGQIDASVDSLKKELAGDPRNGECLSWLGIVELAAGHPELATGPLDAAAEISPSDLSILEYRGRAHSQVAQASYARMAQLNPDAWQVHKVRAELFLSENRDRDAIAEYEAALENQQRNPDIYEGLGDAYRHLNELESARKAYAKELEIAPSNPIAMYNLGSTDIDLGDSAAGIPLLLEMLKVYHDVPVAEFYLGRGLAESGKDAEAAEHLKKSAAGDSKGEVGRRSYYELVRVYRKLHKPEDADKALAAYNSLRAADDKKNADKLADWRKLNGTVPAASSTNP
jgi:tetratricopeptide (TPR) repeat protein